MHADETAKKTDVKNHYGKVIRQLKLELSCAPAALPRGSSLNSQVQDNWPAVQRLRGLKAGECRRCIPGVAIFSPCSFTERAGGTADEKRAWQSRQSGQSVRY